MDPQRSVSPSSGNATAWRVTRPPDEAPTPPRDGGGSAHVETPGTPQGPVVPRRAVLAIACVWLLALGIAFFLNRGEDAGHLVPLIMRALGGMWAGPVWGASGLVASVGGLIIACLVVLSWLGLGDLAVRLYRRG